ncbi:hypothetical protein K439DRAFT_652977 [Ramaria rubella]|nr:hypothetical protein K439DRAFT_652977 [Ramaria rubella]
MLTSYPQPNSSSLQVEEPQSLRPLVPLLQLPAPVTKLSPRLDVFPPSKPAALPGYLRTSHVVPAAFPRTLPQGSNLRDTTTNGEKGQAKALSKAFVEVKLEFESPETQQATRGKSHTVMWNCIDRYVRISPEASLGTGITLFLTHANGFSRQIWEPTLARLISLMESNPSSGVLVDEIWSFEAVQHGDSGLLNVGNHHDIFDWQDHVRDILNFLINYLPEEVSSSILPTILSRILRRKLSRRVVGVGHSFGGTTLCLAAITQPELFQSLILVEPLIVPTSYKRGPRLDGLIQATIRKPSQFPSREIAKGIFKKYPPMNTWDPAVIDVIMEHGLVAANSEGPTSSSLMGKDSSPVRLKMHPLDEAVVYCEWLAPYEAWTGLENLDPRVSLHWIMSGDTNKLTGGFATTQMTVWRRAVNTTNVRLPGVGHLIVQESPENLGAELFRYLKHSMQKYVSKL